MLVNINQEEIPDELKAARGSQYTPSISLTPNCSKMDCTIQPITMSYPFIIELDTARGPFC